MSMPPVSSALLANQLKPTIERSGTPELRGRPLDPAPSSRPKTAGVSQVIQIRYNSSAPDHTRVVLDLSADVTFQKGWLPNPDRLFLDLADTKLARELAGKSFGVDDGRLRKIRVSQFQQTVVRVVFEMESNTEYSIFPLADPSRLVIDVRARPHGTQPILAHGDPATAVPPKASAAIPPARDLPAKANIELSGRQAINNIQTAGVEPQRGPSDSFQESFAAVMVNGKLITQFGNTLKSRDGRFLVTSEVLRDARLAELPPATVTIGGKAYYSLDAVPGASYRFDEEQQVLAIQVLPASFAKTIIDNRRKQPYTPTPPPFGLVLNHDMQFLRTIGGQQLGGLFDAKLFSSLGVLSSDVVKTDFLSATRMLRLDTRFTREIPGKMQMLTFGDTVSASDTWSQSVHFAGVQFARNFAIQPFFVPFALPTMQAQAAQPSTVDIYMNNVLTMRQTVDAGPFAIQNIPVITPEGDMRMVVTDMMGRQQIITRSYLSISNLLRKGVSSYSYETGIMRWGEGTTSDSYHTPFLSGTHGYGVRDSLTVNFRGEVLGVNQTFGFGSMWGIKKFALVAANVAASHSDAGVGRLVYGLLQRRTTNWQMGGSIQFATPAFRQLGLLPGQLSPRMQAQAQLGRSFGRLASIAVGYLNRQCQGTVSCDDPYRHFSAGTASFGIRLWHWGTLGTSATYSPAVQNGVSFAATLSIPLQNRRNIVASAALSGQSQSGFMEFQQSVPNGDGYGYRVRASSDNTDVAAGLDLRNRYGMYSFATERSSIATQVRTEERGGIAFIGNQLMVTRWLDNSFALVDVPGQPGIRVYANNQYITKTDSRGKAIVPMVPFDGNVVRLDDKDVPVQLAMDLEERRVVPFSNAGMLVRFKTEETKGATLLLRSPDGKPLPLGSQVTVAGSETVYEVAYDGEVFIQDLVTPAQIRVRSQAFECVVSVPKAPAGVSLPRIGPLTCDSK